MSHEEQNKKWVLDMTDDEVYFIKDTDDNKKLAYGNGDVVRWLNKKARKMESTLEENNKRIVERIPVDRNAKMGGLLNFASWGVTDEYSAFQAGFRQGYNCHTDETLEAFKLLDNTNK